MEAKDKALKALLTVVAVLAILMVGYYKFAWRLRRTENDVNFQEKVAPLPDEKNSFSGAYSADQPLEGMGKRVGFFSVNKKDDGTGYFASLKMDTIGSTQDDTSYITCGDVRIGEKDFFLGCSDPSLGEISFNGESQRTPAGAVSVAGKVLWVKEGAEVVNRATTLLRTTN